MPVSMNSQEIRPSDHFRNQSPLWWQTAIIYQIYPRSFQDSNRDGIGDLRGILSRLDYLESLQVRCLWLSPIYPSPMYDFGYDVADYTAIHPIFGTLADFRDLLSEVHTRGMKLILDLVPNHTSHEHPWFIESRSHRHHPKRDWYFWRDPAPDGGPPNNWLSFFGGPAWSFDETTDQYYLHQFAREQPELNYRNPVVLEAMLDCMRYWLDFGVDGFRVDVIWLLIKDALLRDEPVNPDWDGFNPHARLIHLHTAHQPEVHEVIRAMRQLLDGYSERVIVGEIGLAPQELMPYYGQAHDECHLPVNFRLIHIPWRAQAVREAVNEYEGLLPPGCWPNWVLGNHDQRRLVNRIGKIQARVATMLLLTLRGTPTCYYGDELGMQDGIIPPHLVRDPQAVNQPEIAAIMGRDPQRTPMQWDSLPHAGFTAAEVEPWLPVSADYRVCNVAVQESDPYSFINFFRALTRLRQATSALLLGDYAEVPTGLDSIFAYTRTFEGQSYLVVLNFASQRCNLDLGGLRPMAELLISTQMRRRGNISLTPLLMEADEGAVLKL
jgi:alpha-glucosidase